MQATTLGKPLLLRERDEREVSKAQRQNLSVMDLSVKDDWTELRIERTNGYEHMINDCNFGPTIMEEIIMTDVGKPKPKINMYTKCV